MGLVGGGWWGWRGLTDLFVAVVFVVVVFGGFCGDCFCGGGGGLFR